MCAPAKGSAVSKHFAPVDPQWQANYNNTAPTGGTKDPATGAVLIGAAQSQGSTGGVLGQAGKTHMDLAMDNAADALGVSISGHDVAPKSKPVEPDTADILLRSADGAALMRARASNGRKASFLSARQPSILAMVKPQDAVPMAMPTLERPGGQFSVLAQSPSAAWQAQTANFASSAGIGGDKKPASAKKKGY